MKDFFTSVSANPNNPKWNNYISRLSPLYSRKNDVRSEFERDFNRIIHTNAFKT